MAATGFSTFSLSVLLIMMCLLSSGDLQTAFSSNFYQYFDFTWGHPKILKDGKLLTLSLDKTSGSAFQSKSEFLFGKISMQLKLVAGYLSSKGSSWDEVDFEFLGNVSGDPYTVHTNVITQGKHNRFYVDDTPIRQFKNLESKGIPFPKEQPMRIQCSLWNADDWATRGGLIKTGPKLLSMLLSGTSLRMHVCGLLPLLRLLAVSTPQLHALRALTSPGSKKSSVQEACRD